MKKIHPKLNYILFKCSCGNKIYIWTVINKNLVSIDVCNLCHPFYTGEHKIKTSNKKLKRFNF